jgi:TRAP-type C4-dicarboxylate transport system permease small subunit
VRESFVRTHTELFDTVTLFLLSPEAGAASNSARFLQEHGRLKVAIWPSQADLTMRGVGIFFGGPMGHLKRINEWLCDVFLWIGGVALVVMTAVSCINVILRMVATPIAGIYDLVCYLGALVASLPLAYTQLKKGHIAVDIVSLMFPARLRKTAIGVSYVLGMIFFAAAAWKLAGLGNILMNAGEVSETLKMPFWPFTYAVAVSCGLMVFCLFVDVVEMFVSPAGGEK